MTIPVEWLSVVLVVLTLLLWGAWWVGYLMGHQTRHRPGEAP